MPRITFSLDDLPREIASFVANVARAKERLAAWDDHTEWHSAREEIFVRGTTRLYKYTNSNPRPQGPPLLLVYSLVNRPSVLDLQPGNSLIGELVAAGFEVYLIDWGSPTFLDRTRTLSDYIVADLDACVETIRGHCCGEPVNLLGICQGGVFSVCYAALFPHKVANLITTVTPIDFQTPTDLLSALLRHIDVDVMVDNYGNLPGALLNALFLAQKPLQLSQRKYLEWIIGIENEPASTLFLAMERWIFDSPALAGAALREFAATFYRQNSFMQGLAQIGSHRVSLVNVTCPVLNIYAARDHLVPPTAARAMRNLVGTKDYSEIELAAGHLGIYVSAKIRQRLVAIIREWLSARSAPSKKRS